MKTEYFHGENGFGNVEFWDPAVYPADVNFLVQQKHAVEIIRDLVMQVRNFQFNVNVNETSHGRLLFFVQHPHRISLICVGPLTNIALALRTYPEIKEHIRDVYIMGGNFKGSQPI